MANYALTDFWAVEKTLKSHPTLGFVDLASSSHILVAMIEKKGNLKLGNEGGNFAREFGISGSRMILPAIFALGQGELVTRAGMYSALSISAPGTNGYDYVDYAKYEYATLRLAFRLDWRMQNFLSGVPESRNPGYDPYEIEIRRMKNKARALVQAQLVASNNAAENTILGLGYLYPDTPSGSSNAPGGFAYNDANYGALWRPSSRSMAGPWLKSYMTQGQMETRFDNAEEGTSAADLCLMVEPSGSSTPKLYSSLLDEFTDATRIPADADMAKLGFSNVRWDGGSGPMVVAPLVDGTAGNVYFLRSDMHFIGTEKAPIGVPPQRVDGTNVDEWMFVLPFCHGAIPRREGKQYGYT